MNSKERMLEKIEENIKLKRPIPSWIISSVRLGSMGFCILLLLFSIMFIGIFILDIFEKASIEEFVEQNIYNPSHFLFECVLIALILVAFFVFMYRKFDWPLVKEKNKIFTIAILFVFIFGFGIAKLAENVFFIRQSLHTVKDAYEDNAPVRSAQKIATNTVLEASNNILGIISSLKEEGENIVISIKIKNVENTYSIKESSITEKLRVGEKVAIHLDTDQKTILKIKIIK